MMKKHGFFLLRRAVLAVTTAFAALICSGALAFGAFAENVESDIYGSIDRYLSETVPKTHFPSFAVTIVDKDRVLLSKAYGGGSTSAPYLVGSVSKSFTALCIMRLAEQGKIDLDAPLCAYLPDVTDSDKITIIQLLNHTSGLGEHQNMSNCKVINKQGEHTYANVNYSLLGRVIEAVSGQSYKDYITENVFEPLGLENTSADPIEAQKHGLIDGYENWFGLNVETPCRYNSSDSAWITVPAGYISTSSDDLGRYLQMYLRGGEGIVSPEGINEMFYRNTAVDDYIPYKYGMGWTLIKEPLTEPALRHSGLVETGMGCIYILPESGVAVALTVNSNDYFVGKDFADRIGWGIILMLIGMEPNQIGAGEYVSRHLMYDGIYTAVIVISVLPLLLIGKYKDRLYKGGLAGKIVPLVLIHAALPVFILSLSQIFFDTPLWVVRAFVPDMYAVIVVSSGLLFLGGVIKIIVLIKGKAAK